MRVKPEPYPIPTECIYCGAEVILTTNDYIYGRRYRKNGNCKCYACTLCKASVGTHPDGKTPLGRLANRELKELKKKVHAIFDPIWKSGQKKRSQAYVDLAIALDIPTRECHFGWFGKEMLLKAIAVLMAPPEYPKEDTFMAIVRPENMDFTGKKFSMIISGPPGVGKTTLALSAPNPVIIDFDKGISRVKAKHRKPSIMAATHEEVLADIESPDMKDFETIIVDTGGSFVTYLQDWAMRSNVQNKKKGGGISQTGFGAVKAEFIRFTNMLQYTFNKHIIYIFHTVEEKDKDVTKHRLLCEGSARNLVWQPCDIGCFLQIISEDRVVGFSPTEEYFAKGCYGVSGLHKLPQLGDGVENDYLTKLFTYMQSTLVDESLIYAEAKEAYKKAMTEGRQLVDEITGVAEANKFLEVLNTIEHSLTSEKEIKVLAKVRLANLGITWDKEAKAWVGPAEPETETTEPADNVKTNADEPPKAESEDCSGVTNHE